MDQACFLCEETLEVWSLWQDPESAAEHWTIEPADHDCIGLRDLMRERIRASYKRGQAGASGISGP
jgi:hypothetical protein